MNREIQVGILLMISATSECAAHSEEIHIRVLNATTESQSLTSVSPCRLVLWHGGDLVAPTNKDGVVVLHLARNEVTADSVSPSPCDRTAILGPKPLPKDGDTIAITSDEYVDCQEWAKVIPGEAPKDNLNRAPSYRIKKILESGVAAGNRCGRFRAEAKPGELIFFVRPLTLREKMQR